MRYHGSWLFALCIVILKFTHVIVHIANLFLFNDCWELFHCCCCCWVTQLWLTFCDPVDCSTPGLLDPHHLLEFAQFHVHFIGDAVMPSHPLMLSSSSVLNLSQNQGYYQWVLFTSDAQNTGASALVSVLPVNIQVDLP